MGPFAFAFRPKPAKNRPRKPSPGDRKHYSTVVRGGLFDTSLIRLNELSNTRDRPDPPVTPENRQKPPQGTPRTPPGDPPSEADYVQPKNVRKYYARSPCLDLERWVRRGLFCNSYTILYKGSPIGILKYREVGFGAKFNENLREI